MTARTDSANRLDSIETTERMTLLLDYYGEMLTEHQRNLMQLYYDENLSLAEIAEQEDISRQAVRDILVRSSGILERCEEKIAFIQRSVEFRALLGVIEGHLLELNDLNQKRYRSQELVDLCNKIYEAISAVNGPQ